MLQSIFAYQALGNMNRHSPDGAIIETLPYVLIPVNLLTEEEIERVRRIRQMNYPD